MQCSVQFNTVRELNVFRTCSELAALTANDAVAALSAGGTHFLLKVRYQDFK